MSRSLTPKSLLLIVALLASALPVAGQPAVGDRVRVSVASGSTHVGTVRVWNDREIELDAETGRVSLPRDAVRRAELSTGSRSYTTIGLVGGASLGAVTGVGICSVGETCSILSDDIRLEVIVTSALVGLVVGGFIGSRIRREHWEEVVSSDLLLDQGRFGFRVRLAPPGG